MQRDSRGSGPGSTPSERRRGRGARVLHVAATLALVVGGLAVVPISLLALGTFLPQIPLLGAVGSMALPSSPGFFTLLTLVPIALLAFGYLVRRSKVAMGFLALSLASLTACIVVTANQLLVAHSSGVSISPGMVLRPTAATRRPEPDAIVPYATAPDGSPVSMNVYLPDPQAVPDGGAPIVMYIHGGGWISGDPYELGSGLTWLADQGYVVVSPEYTLASENQATWNVAMPQIGCALIQSAAHAPEWRADPHRIAVFGGSAGGNLTLATTYAAAAGRLTPACPGDVPPVAAVGGDVPAVDPLTIFQNTDAAFGAATRDMVTRYLGGTPDVFPERLEAISPITYAGSRSPATLIYASESDHLVPIAGTKNFVEMARAQGTPIDVVYRPWADHTISMSALQGQAVLNGLVRHFRAHGV